MREQDRYEMVESEQAWSMRDRNCRNNYALACIVMLRNGTVKVRRVKARHYMQGTDAWSTTRRNFLDYDIVRMDGTTT